MITQKDRIEAAIRHIQTSVDIDPWAMELAISALKAQIDKDINVPNNDDTIYRQMAIDAILHLTNQDSVRGQYEFVKKHGLEKTWSGGIVDAIDAVIAVPPAQPDLQPTCNQLATDTISRQAAIDALAEQMPQPFTPDGSHPADEGIFMAQEIYADCIETLKLLPSAEPDLSGYSDLLWKNAYERGKRDAQPEVIRCKDCKHIDEDGVCQNSKGLAIQDDDDYCSYAERRTDGNGRD